jgi:ribosomal-protein-alanine N-acetyltransferase
MINTNFNPFPNLSSRRFNLRRIADEDDNEIFVLRSEETVLKYLGRPPAKYIDDAREFITKINKGISRNEWIYWVITLKTDNKLIGTICLWNIDSSKSIADIGFELMPEYMGKGIMQEVIPVIIEFGFNTMKLEIINGEVDPENIKSIKLLERFGFKYERKFENTLVYSLSNST